MNERISILILESEKTAAYAALRALSKVGYQTCAASHIRHNISFSSIYTYKKIICPDIEKNYDAYYMWLYNELQNNIYLTVFAFSDKTTRLLSAFKNELSKYTFIYQPSINEINKVLNKQITYQLANETGVKVPTSYNHTCHSPEELADNLKYPVVLKPNEKITWYNGKSSLNKVVKANYVWKKEEFIQKYNLLKEKNIDFDIQEYIDGVGRGYFCLVLNKHQYYPFAHERLREYPITGGASSARKSIEYSEICQISTPLIEILDWFGPIMLEFKYNNKNKMYYLMEINGRWWGSLPLAINAGVNYPVYLAEFIRCRKIFENIQYPVNFTSRLLFPHDMMWLLGNVFAGNIFKSINFFKKLDSEDVWDKKDRAAFFMNIVAHVTQYFIKKW